MRTFSQDMYGSELWSKHCALAHKFIPHEWRKHLNCGQLNAWANLFARGGFATYSPALKPDLIGGKMADDCLGTFVKAGQESKFVAVDSDGIWVYNFTNEKAWFSNTLFTKFYSRCCGFPDFSGGWGERDAAELHDKIVEMSKSDTVFRALLSLGRTWEPSP